MAFYRSIGRAALLSGALIACSIQSARATAPPVSGPLPPHVAAAFAEGLFDLPAPSGGLGVSAVRPSWNIPVVLVSFTDDALEYGPADFNLALFDSTGATSTGSAYDYYRWVSGGRLALRGRVVASVQLPHPRNYYAYGASGLNRLSTPRNLAGLVYDALVLSDPFIDWSDFDVDRDGFVDMLWVVHAGIGGEAGRSTDDLWSITSALNGQWNNSTPFESATLLPGSNSQHLRIDRFSVLPERSLRVDGARSEIGVYCHEFGHALGLPDLYNTQDPNVRNTGPGHWSLMSTGGSGGDGLSPESPTRMSAWELLFLGWAESVRPAFDTTLVLPPHAAGARVLDLQFQGEPAAEHFLIEYRRREAFDRNLPGEGLIVYHIDEGIMGLGVQNNTVNAGFTPGLKLVEADGHSDLTQGADRGGPGDPFPGLFDRTMLFDDLSDPSTRTFRGVPTQIGLFGIAPQGNGVRVSAQVRAPGWLATADRTEPGYDPIDLQTPAGTTAVGEDGSLWRVGTEFRGGRAQVILRERVGGVWRPAIEVSQSPADAIEPALAAMPGGDLAVVWVDTRLGRAMLFYRFRVGGAWSVERLLANLPGESRAPAIGVDPHGAAHVTWLSVVGNQSRLMLMRFPYLSPYAQPLALTPLASLPSSPTLAMDPEGGSYVLWSERSTNPPTAMFVHYHPDTTLKPPQRLGLQSSYSVNAAHARVSPDGTLHAVWLAIGSAVSDIHYQRRPPGVPPSPADTVIESRGGTIRDVRLALDTEGGIHVVFENVANGVDQVRYKRRHPTRGWDARSTEVTLDGEGGGSEARVFAEHPGVVTVLYDRFTSQGVRMIERRRLSDSPPALDAPATATFARPLTLRAAPNPLRAGHRLALRAPATGASGAGVADVFDLAGRRMATVAMEPEGTALHGVLPGAASAGWTAGIYFVRLRESPGTAARIVLLR